MATWNYRVLAHISKNPIDKNEVYFEIHEVHYEKKDKPKSFTKNGVSVGGVGYLEVQWVLSEILECLTKPVLSADNFPREYEGDFLNK